jgi:hypothetical protein
MAVKPKRKPAAEAPTQKLPSFVINKTAGSLIRVQFSEYKGKQYLDFRSFYHDRESGTYKPTPKGCGVPIEMSKKFLLRLKKLIAAGEELGLPLEEQAEE